MSIFEANINNFEELTNEGFTIVDFYSETCNPCKTLALHLKEVDADIPFINIIKVNTTQYPEFHEKYGIMAVPTIIFMKEGKEVNRYTGLMSTDEIKAKISEYYY